MPEQVFRYYKVGLPVAYAVLQHPLMQHDAA
jgi:hypothetical protein